LCKNYTRVVCIRFALRVYQTARKFSFACCTFYFLGALLSVISFPAMIINAANQHFGLITSVSHAFFITGC
jgi:hypothetical protein